jgi:hypothetical protein
MYFFEAYLSHFDEFHSINYFIFSKLGELFFLGGAKPAF